MADLPVPVTSAEEVRRVTEAVLARPEFIEAQPSWFDRAWRWVADLVTRFLDTVGGGDRGSTVGTVTLLVVAVALLLAVLWFTRSVRRDRRLDLVVEGPAGRRPQEWLADAAALEAAGDWRGALRCRYRAMVSELAAHGLVEEVPGRTTGEYLALVQRDVPPAAAPFEAATRRFEAAWYGHGEVGATDTREFAATAEAAVAAAGGRRRTAVAAGAP